MKEKKVDLEKLIVSHPAYKDLAGAFSLGYKEYTVSSLPLGIKSYILNLWGKLFGGNFLLYEGDKSPVYKLANKKSSYADVLQLLSDYGYERVDDLVEDYQFILKGDIIYISNPIYSSYIRIDFWGESIEEISLVDEITFKKISSLEEIVLSSDEIGLIGDGESFSGVLVRFTLDDPDYVFDFTDVYSIHSNFKLLEKQLDSYAAQNYKVFVSTRYPDRVGKFKDILQFTELSFAEGFRSDSLKIVVYTDSELYDNLVIDPAHKGNEFLDFADVEVGDFIVHKNHGVAIYGGINVVEVENEKREYLILNYAKGDKLYVPREQVSYVSKYVGTGHAPKLTRLGTQEWDKIKGRVKKSLENITKELLELYAKRELKKGFSFSKDTELLENFVDDFQYEDTSDQKRSWNEIRFDMENEKPMDRLLVGDVGFGKTELAMRAAFKAAQDGKQVALLAPTTVLVEQHYSVFKDRFRNYPVDIEILSRFRKDDELERSLKKIESGKVDIVVGTHRLLSKDVEFKDLGLLIVDEEQRFGVKQKERLKMMRENIDVLSMSATPIPRSLNMALSGIKDISVLMEPPKGRRPVKTFLSEFDYTKITGVLLEEIGRGGQAYLVHNNVKTINSFVNKLKEISPKINYVIGHGQMPSETLSTVMRDFHSRKYDVLVCTTIIENGIDMPNVNTIIIDNAQNFGLSQLHQLRGRVGRSGKQAYCYLFHPKGLVLDSIAQKRLDMLVHAQELGAGFKIASKDLEIRGAGNLLGREQSGSICSVGYSLYIQLLKEQMRLMRRME